MRARSILRGIGLLAATPLVLAGMICTALAYPEPFFAYHTARGRLALYSDEPFDASKAQAILADVDARITTSPLDRHEHHAIFVANAQWRQRLFFNIAYGAGGVNFYPITRNVFLRRSDIDRDKMMRRDGKPTESPRTFAYFAAHEVAHSLTGEYLGPSHLWNWRLPQWIREGYADYVGFGSKADLDALYARYRADDPAMDFRKSGQYARFRLLVAFMLQREHWSVQKLLLTGMGKAQAEALMNAAMRRGA